MALENPLLLPAPVPVAVFEFGTMEVGAFGVLPLPDGLAIGAVGVFAGAEADPEGDWGAFGVTIEALGQTARYESTSCSTESNTSAVGAAFTAQFTQLCNELETAFVQKHDGVVQVLIAFSNTAH